MVLGPGLPAGEACDLSRALARLGPDVRLERARGAREALARVEAPDVDLLVVDLALGEEARRLLGALPPGAAPVLAVSDHLGDEAAVAAFGLGAADCLARGGELAEVLPAAALEQIRRRRATLERQQLEKEVEDLRLYNQDIIQNLNSALLVVDPAGRITLANPVAEELLGVEASGVVGRPVWEILPVVPGSRHPLVLSLEEGARLRGVEAAACQAGGTRLPIGMSCAPLVASDGTRLGAVATFQDLSELKTLERQMLQAERMASIGQLAAGVAHEINNPVGFIHANLLQMSEYVTDLSRLWDAVGGLRKAVGAGSLVEARAAEERLARLCEEVDSGYLLADLGTALRESLEGSERIRHIVQDLRIFAHQGGEQEEADLNQCLDSTANIVWTMLKHTARLEKDYGVLPPISCHPMQLQQVFMNLLVNAYQAVESRRRQEPGAEPGLVRLRTRAAEDGVRVWVTDSGTGIEPQHLDRIFEPFFTTKEVGQGMGLGLSTSYDIVRRHGGRLRVESQPGCGTTFEVFLPRGAGGGAT